MFRFLILLLLTFFLSPAFAQIQDPVKWNTSVKRISDTEAELKITATLEEGWHLYSQSLPSDEGPFPTEFSFTETKYYSLIGKVKEGKPKSEYDPNFDMILAFFDGSAEFTQKIKINTDAGFSVKGLVYFMVCNETMCLPPKEIDLTFKLEGTSGEEAPEIVPVVEDTITTGESLPADSCCNKILEILESGEFGTGSKRTKATRLDTSGFIISNGPEDGECHPRTFEGKSIEKPVESYGEFFWLAFLAGLAALITPCVFPMIPMTVTFFMKAGKSRKSAIRSGLLFGFSIIAIYTTIGSLVSVLVGQEAANFLATHWIPNVLFFLIFVVFAASFLGMFEITLPTSFVNKMDAKADKGGLIGVFFMAFTLVLVSFSCTGPVAGTILLTAASGEVLKPFIGMLGYSLAFALPFTLFAIFPNWLSNLPKSGGWLNSVKVVLGFIELALGLKFLSIADQTYHWGILDRDIYLALWIVIFSLMGLYLLGYLKFSHDSDLPFLKVPRLLVAIITFTFVIYLIPGMWGAPLKALSGYLPPQSTHDFDLTRTTGTGGSANELCEAPKYGESLHLPHGLNGYFDYEQGMECAANSGKPVFIDFTGHGCVNCREMEARVWSDPKVLQMLRDDFVVIALYVDDKKIMLPKEEQYISKYDGKLKKNLGEKNFDFQVCEFNYNAQPFYVTLDNKGNLLEAPTFYDLNVDNFVKFLESSKAEYENRLNSEL